MCIYSASMFIIFHPQTQNHIHIIDISSRTPGWNIKTFELTSVLCPGLLVFWCPGPGSAWSYVMVQWWPGSGLTTLYLLQLSSFVIKTPVWSPPPPPLTLALALISKCSVCGLLCDVQLLTSIVSTFIDNKTEKMSLNRYPFLCQTPDTSPVSELDDVGQNAAINYCLLLTSTLQLRNCSPTL